MRRDEHGVQRTAPKGGYRRHGAKQHYRQQVYNVAKEHSWIHGCCLILPSKEGFEIDVANAKGFRRENIHVVDDNPQIISHIKRRFPWVTTYGVAFDRAVERAEKLGRRYSFVNFDSTHKLCRSTLMELSDIGSRDIWSDSAGFAFTLQRGREEAAIFETLRVSATIRHGAYDALMDRVGRGIDRLDAARVLMIGSALDPAHRPWSFAIRRCGRYRNPDGVSMLWAVFMVLKGQTVLGSKDRLVADILDETRPSMKTAAIDVRGSQVHVRPFGGLSHAELLKAGKYIEELRRIDQRECRLKGDVRRVTFLTSEVCRLLIVQGPDDLAIDADDVGRIFATAEGLECDQ